MPAHPVLISALPALRQPEPFVDPDTAAAFVGITRRALLQKVEHKTAVGLVRDVGLSEKDASLLSFSCS